jgi:hypothetical protein
MKVFPELLARKLEELVSEDTELEYSVPIQVRLQMRLEDLVEDKQSEFRERSSATSSVVAKFSTKMGDTLGAALGLPANILPELAAPERIPIPASTSTSDDYSSFVAVAENAIEQLLLTWLKVGALELSLSEFTAAELESWHAALYSPVRARIQSEPSQFRDAEQEVDLVLAQLPALSSLNYPAQIRRRLMIAVRIAEKLCISLKADALWHSLDRIVPLNQLETKESVTSVVSTESNLSPMIADVRQSLSPHEQRLVTSPLENPHLAKPITGQWDAHISSVLPFLLIGPLSRMGYFATLSAVLEAAKAQNDSPIFGAALAYKVLDPPDRGWRRTLASQLTAAVLAGQDTPLSDESLHTFSRRISGHTGPLERLLSEKIIEGHATGAPVILLRADSPSPKNYLLVDFPGCFPIVLAAQITEIIPLLTKLQKPVLLVPRSVADPHVLQELHRAGIAFITNASPSRNEHWQAVRQGPTLLGWANYGSASSSELREAGRNLSCAIEDSESFWQAIGVSRPGIIRPSEPDLERCVTLSVSLALGIVSWKLWNSRGRTTPQLAIERFADLDARVRFDARCVSVRLPLGRRYQELFDSGLLASVSGVPWLAGRRVEFNGG